MNAVAPIPPRRLLGLLNIRAQFQELQKRHIGVLALLIRRLQRYGRQGRRRWVKQCIERRMLFDQYHTLMTKMRMPSAMFYELLQRITSRIQKSERNRRQLETGLKLAITLRYIVTGNSYMSLQYSFRVALNTIALFIKEVYQATIDEFQNKVFAFPINQEEWRDVAQNLTKDGTFTTHAEPERYMLIVMAAICLHNLMATISPGYAETTEFFKMWKQLAEATCQIGRARKSEPT